jgi:hypothetical protein
LIGSAVGTSTERPLLVASLAGNTPRTWRAGATDANGGSPLAFPPPFGVGLRVTNRPGLSSPRIRSDAGMIRIHCPLDHGWECPLGVPWRELLPRICFTFREDFEKFPFSVSGFAPKFRLLRREVILPPPLTIPFSDSPAPRPLEDVPHRSAVRLAGGPGGEEEGFLRTAEDGP